MISTLTPRFSMPESSTAIFAATTDPAPARSVYRLDMSDSTPILIMLSETCACAAETPSAAAIAAAIIVCFIDFMLPPEGMLDAKVIVEFFHVRIEIDIADHVGDPPVLDDVVPVRDRR